LDEDFAGQQDETKLSKKPEAQDVRQCTRQLRDRPDCRSDNKITHREISLALLWRRDDLYAQYLPAGGV
jgi:hypothetical protein